MHTVQSKYKDLISYTAITLSMKKDYKAALEKWKRLIEAKFDVQIVDIDVNSVRFIDNQGVADKVFISGNGISSQKQSTISDQIIEFYIKEGFATNYVPLVLIDVC